MQLIALNVEKPYEWWICRSKYRSVIITYRMKRRVDLRYLKMAVLRRGRILRLLWSLQTSDILLRSYAANLRSMHTRAPYTLPVQILLQLLVLLILKRGQKLLCLIRLTMVLGNSLSLAQITTIHATVMCICAKSWINRLWALMRARSVMASGAHSHDTWLVARVEMALVRSLIEASVSCRKRVIKNDGMLNLLDLLANQLIEKGNSLGDLVIPMELLVRI